MKSPSSPSPDKAPRAKAPRTNSVGRPRREEGSSAETAKRILDSAEELLAKHGFHGVTLRAVAAHAQVDTALAHYYFKNKQGLFDAVFVRRAEIVNRERMEGMNRYAQEHPGQMTIEGVISAFLNPLLDPGRHTDPGWKHYFAIIGQANSTSDWGTETMTRFFDPVVTRLIDLLQQVMPDVPRENLYWSYHMLTGSLTLTLSDTGRIDRLSNGLCHSNDIANIAPRLIAYCVAGFRAICQRPQA